MCNHVRHRRTRKRIYQHQGRDDRERRADDAPRRFQKQEHPDNGGDEVERRGLSRARRQFAIEQKQVRAAEGGHRREHPVLHGDPVARRGLAKGVREEAQEEPERKVQRPHLGVIQDEGVEGERQRRGVPELQQRPADAGHRQNCAANPGRLARAEIGFLDQLPNVRALDHRTLLTR